MNRIVTVFLLSVVISSVACDWFHRTPTDTEKGRLLSKLQNFEKAAIGKKLTEENATEAHGSRSKRQLGYAGGLGVGFGAYDYNDYYGDYMHDYNYDYYDWVCSDTACQLCDILTSECCLPDVDINCFLPDSCINNPCLGGGTCITMRTIDDRPDFTCVCLPGLTGKYCQIFNDYFVGADVIDPVFMAGGLGMGVPPPPPPPPAQPAYPQQSYEQPQQAYEQPQQQYQAPAAPQYEQPQPQYQAPAAPQYEQPQPQYQAPAAPQYQAPAAPQYQAPAVPQYQAAPAAPQYQNDGQYGSKNLGARRLKCNQPGQIFNADQGACVDFHFRTK